ncbi:MAG TPA: hypothetical protein VIL84_15175 [Devosiaceae bacterium]
MARGDKGDGRLRRLFARLERRVPAMSGFFAWVRRPEARLVRLPLAVLLIAGGAMSFLPILGIWMLPLGLIILALDLAFLRSPVSGTIMRFERWFALQRRKWRKR